MRDQTLTVPVIVTLPACIDLISQERAYDQLYAAFASGASVVIADFTATTSCDSSSLLRLAAIQHRAVASGAELRLVMPPGGVVRALAQLMEVGSQAQVYRSVKEAEGPPARDTRMLRPARDRQHA
jgi:anti-anti-sigma regulatory factor